MGPEEATPVTATVAVFFAAAAAAQTAGVFFVGGAAVDCWEWRDVFLGGSSGGVLLTAAEEGEARAGAMAEGDRPDDLYFFCGGAVGEEGAATRLLVRLG